MRALLLALIIGTAAACCPAPASGPVTSTTVAPVPMSVPPGEFAHSIPVDVPSTSQMSAGVPAPADTLPARSACPPHAGRASHVFAESRPLYRGRLNRRPHSVSTRHEVVAP